MADAEVECLLIPLQELIASEWLSKCTLSVNGDDDDRCVTHVNNLRCLNAARLSLMLARSLARSDDTLVDIPSLKLDSFYVKLVCPISDAGKCVDAESEGVAHDGYDPMPLDYNIEPSNSNEAETLDFISDFLGAVDGGGFPGGETTSEESSGVEFFGNEQFVATGGEGLFSSDKETFERINAASDNFQTQWSLLGIELQQECSLNKEKSGRPPQSLLPLLGRMIHAIFTPADFGQDHLHTVFEMSLVLQEGASICDERKDEQPCSKLQRRKDRSLFFDLVEASGYPVSVCRLISDAIESPVETAMGVTPITLDNVIEDLGQMSSRPEIYLDDPEDGFFSSELRFGHGCYGRTEQVTRILEVASSLEASGARSSDCVEAVFIKGIGGCGKTFLVKSIGAYLESQGWMTLGAKFEAGLQHESRGTISSVFRRLLVDLIQMRDGSNWADAEYARQGIQAISASFDRDDLCALAHLIPEVKDVAQNRDELDPSDELSDPNDGSSQWRLIFLLSTLLGAILSAGELLFSSSVDLY